MIEWANGVWQVNVREHSTGLQATVALLDLSNLLRDLEAVLAGGAVPWRPYKSYKGQPFDEKRKRS